MSDNAQMPFVYGRAWVEIDLDALARNAAELRSQLPESCELMAVVKTDAYGHGAAKAAARLQDEGVRAFAVATVGEGASLRETGIKGDILVLGYTHPADVRILSDNQLIQLVIDGACARMLNASGYKLRVHIAVDSGMHRLGIASSDIDEIESVFKCENLAVEGIATHLASSDSLDPSDMDFVRVQAGRFYSVLDALKEKGYEPGKVHIQASYGMLNHPDLACDYARYGIALYGVMSHYEDTVLKPALSPVLSLRAIIAQVRWIAAGESVSYGRIFTADSPMKLATVCIGYADGVPRQASGNGGVCLVRGQKAPIVGRICMDLIMIDVTGVDSVAEGDVATLIGADGDEAIRCEQVAAAAGTITNDILCRLGSRLPRVYTGERA